MDRYKITWSLDARLDLLDILGFYLRRNQNANYSRKLHTKINKGIKLLAKNPYLGTPTDYNSVRTLISGDYQIIYEIFNKLIVIIMVWDCRRDPEDRMIDDRKRLTTED